MSDGLQKWNNCKWAENERTTYSHIDDGEITIKDCTYMIYHTPPRSVANRACSATPEDCANCGVYKNKRYGKTEVNKTTKPRSKSSD